MDKPPLYYWTAALFAKLFSPLLPLHDGARLASGFYTALAMLFTGLASRKLYGENRGWAAAVILIGCLGMLVRAHQMITDLALLTGCAMLLYGFAQSQERVLRAGIWIGTGMGIGFMSKGFIAAGAVRADCRAAGPRCSRIGASAIICAASLSPRYVPCRGSPSGRCCCISILRNCSPTGRGRTTSATGWIMRKPYRARMLFYYLKEPAWLAWPALPLAVWAVWQSRQTLGAAR